jgi:glycosyltransferase involved in cell wall biosynthesis
MPIETVKDTRKRTFLSIIIRCKNEFINILRLLESIENQSFRDYDIIFIDGGSTDGTLNYLNKLPYSVFKIAPGEFNYGTSCDQGATLVDSPYFMLLSGHTYLVQKNLLEDSIKYVNSYPEIAGLYFRQIPNQFTGCSCLEQAFLAYRFPNGKEFVVNNHTGLRRLGFSNSAAIVKRSVWEKVHYGYCLASEDRIWADKVVRLGYSTIYAPHLWVEHSHEETPAMVERRVYFNIVAWNNYKEYKKIVDWPLFYAMKKLLLMIAFGPIEEWRQILGFTMASYRGAKKAWLTCHDKNC